MLKYTKVQTPRGAKDILPPDGHKRTLIETEAARFLEGWGYARIYTPSLEFYDALAQGDGPQVSDQLYRFVDRDGTTLALRPEMTTPVARVAATRFSDDDAPLRLYYTGSVFRYDEPQLGRSREFTQIGAELLGVAGPIADAEIVAMSLSTFDALGLERFVVDLGHIGFVNGILNHIDDVEFAESIKAALLERDFVRYETIVRSGKVGDAIRAALLGLPTLRGGAEVLQEARRLARALPVSVAALDDLARTYALIEAYGLADRVAIDLCMTKALDYYTGILLEGYTPELGFMICNGGRYDGLVGRFGRDWPAVGFAFGVERAMLALERQGWTVRPPAPDVLVYVESDTNAEDADATALCAAVAALRAKGVRVEAGIDCTSRSSARAYADRRGIERTLCVVRLGEDEIGLRVDGSRDEAAAEGAGRSRIVGIDEFAEGVRA